MQTLYGSLQPGIQRRDKGVIKPLCEPMCKSISLGLQQLTNPVCVYAQVESLFRKYESRRKQRLSIAHAATSNSPSSPLIDTENAIAAASGDGRYASVSGVGRVGLCSSGEILRALRVVLTICAIKQTHLGLSPVSVLNKVFIALVILTTLSHII